MAGALGPVQGCEKQGDSRRCAIQLGVRFWSWCSSGLCQQSASLHHCIRVSIQGVPYRLSIGDGEERLAGEHGEDIDYGV